MKIPIEVDLGILDTYHLEDLELVYAVAELIDNSIGSYYRHKDKFDSPLEISIECTSDRFSISDNAAGISADDFGSALIMGKRNQKNRIANDLGIYGVGLKRSVLWIGRTTIFKSASLEDGKSYSLTYPKRNLDGSYMTETELELRQFDGKSGLTIEITDLYHDNVQGFNTSVIDNLKTSLGLIYQKFIESDDLYITINTQKLNVQKREILVDRYYTCYKETGFKQAGLKYCLTDHKAKKIEWKIRVESSRGDYRISGWLGIKMGAPKSGIGIYVYRENRGILGIPPAVAYNPFDFKVGDSNYLRLFGEIEIHGFKKPTMGNALPEKNILDMLFIDFKQNLTYKQVDVNDEQLYNFFKQLTQHKVNMIDSRPCPADPIVLPTNVQVKQGDKPSEKRTTFIPYNYGSPEIEEPKSLIPNDIHDFSYVIDAINFEMKVYDGQINSINYTVEDRIFYVEIRSVTKLVPGYLKLLANYILLFHEANPILNRNPSDIAKVLPQ